MLLDPVFGEFVVNNVCDLGAGRSVDRGPPVDRWVEICSSTHRLSKAGSSYPHCRAFAGALSENRRLHGSVLPNRLEPFLAGPSALDSRLEKQGAEAGVGADRRALRDRTCGNR